MATKLAAKLPNEEMPSRNPSRNLHGPSRCRCFCKVTFFLHVTLHVTFTDLHECGVLKNTTFWYLKTDQFTQDYLLNISFDRGFLSIVIYIYIYNIHIYIYISYMYIIPPFLRAVGVQPPFYTIIPHGTSGGTIKSRIQTTFSFEFAAQRIS